MMTIATPLGDDSTRKRAVLAVHVNLERMDEIILEKSGLGSASESYLVDSFNVFLSAERFGREEFPRGVHSPGIDTALQGTDGSGLYLNYKDVPVLGVYRWLDHLAVALLTEMPQQEAFAPARSLAWITLLAGLLIAALLTAGIYLLARQIARPVLHIAQTAGRVADGDLTARAPVLTDDEIGGLARSFNEMTGQLSTLYEDLKQEITERKRAEEERTHLIAELETQNTELERFTYTVSHDLKSPLITIKGFLGLLQQDTQHGDAERVRFDVEQIGNAADTMLRLLDELLELSRIGRVINPPEDVPLSELVHEAVDLVAGRIRKGNVTVEVAPEMPLVVGDRVRLVEVFQNLIDNAIKFMGGQEAPRIEIGARNHQEEVICYVKDNGIGIEPPYREKNFGLFNRLDVDREGTGVGLALVKRIVEIHGGRVWVESEGPGHGSTFFFTLPVAQAG